MLTLQRVFRLRHAALGTAELISSLQFIFRTSPLRRQPRLRTFSFRTQLLLLQLQQIEVISLSPTPLYGTGNFPSGIQSLDWLPLPGKLAIIFPSL